MLDGRHSSRNQKRKQTGAPAGYEFVGKLLRAKNVVGASGKAKDRALESGKEKDRDTGK